MKEAELRGLRYVELSTLSSCESERVPREDQPSALPNDCPRGSFRSTNILASCFSFGSSPIPSPHSVPSLARSRSPPPFLGARPRPPPPFLCLKVYLQQKGEESKLLRGREREPERELEGSQASRRAWQADFECRSRALSPLPAGPRCPWPLP